jgi:hypothetical protein
MCCYGANDVFIMDLPTPKSGFAQDEYGVLEANREHMFKAFEPVPIDGNPTPKPKTMKADLSKDYPSTQNTVRIIRNKT